MKKITLIMLALLVTTITTNAQWNLQTNPLGTGQNAMLGKIQFVSATEGWIACGSNGSLLHTTDAGVTWKQVNPFPSDNVINMSDPGINMSWVNPTHGWILKTFGNFSNNTIIQNGAVLYGTADGGSTWSRKIFPKSVSTISYNTADLQGVWQMHELVAANNTNLSSWAGWLHSSLTLDANGNGNFSGMTKSSDITNFPTSVSMSISSSGVIAANGDFHGFMSADKNTGYITTSDGGGGYGLGVMQKVSTGVTYATTDLQGTWQMHSLITANPSSSNQYSGWMYGTISFDASGNGTASFIKPNGTKTQNIAVSISTDGIVTMNGTDFYGFMSADKKSISITMTDGGSDGYDFMVMQKVNPSISYSSKDLQGVWQTHILTTANSPTNNLNQLSGWKRGTITLNANGEGNVNLITNSNVKNENRISLSISSLGVITPSSSSELQINHLNGFINEDKSTIVMTITDDNGAYEIIIMQKDLSSSGDVGLQVQFTDANNGWLSVYNMIYGNFQLFKTTDGGSTWNPVTTNAGGFYQFLDANNGWMVGSSVNNVGGDNLNNIYHSTDGGTNWTLQASNIGKANALNFSDLTHGWVVGQGGLVMKTTDGGTNWSAVTNTGQTTNSNSKCVFFLDANNGWIGSGYDNTEGVGTRFVLATKDGGASWTTQSTPVTNDIFSMFFWDAENGWFTSDYGQIAHYTYTPPKTVTISAGGLSGALSPTELSTTKNLAINGTIDARDFKTMRDEMPLLASVDLSGTTIAGYIGIGGTYGTSSKTYAANTIPNQAFYNATTKIGKTNLNSIVFPWSITSIDGYSFVSSGLTSVTIPANVNTIGYGAFYSCNNLSTVNFATNSVLDSIASFAFGVCPQITSFQIPALVSHIGDVVFTGTNAWVTVNPSNSNFTTIDGVLFDKGVSKLMYCPAMKGGNYIIPFTVKDIAIDAFYNCKGLSNITIPSSVTTIEEWAFENCFGLYNISIPASVTNIKSYAFYNCSNARSIYANATTPIDLSTSDSVFQNINKSACILFVPVGSVPAYQAANQWKDFINIQEINQLPTGTTAADYYLPLKVGNYTKLHTNYIAPNTNWCDRSTKYSFIKSDNINGLQYLLEEGWEGDYLPGECEGANPVFRYEWLRKDDAGNIMLGAISTGDQYGNLSPDINAAMILPTPMAIFPNKFLNVNEFISYQQSDTVMSIDSVISVTATAGSFTNCIQVRSLHRTKSGIVNYIEDSYYAYHVGLVMQNRILPISQTHTNYITDYVTDSPLGVKEIKGQENNATLYPNPATERFYVNTGNKAATISIFNQSGEVMFSKQISGNEMINISTLSNGMYIVKLVTADYTTVKKLIKE